METISVDTLKPNISFTGDLFIDSTFLLLPQSADISENLIKQLKAWNFENILCEGSLSLGKTIDVGSQDDDEQAAPKEKIGEKVKQILQESKSIPVGNNDSARMEMVLNVYNEYLKFIESLFTHYVTHKEIDQKELADSVQELCIFIKDHRRFILRINNTPEVYIKENFIITHTMRTTVLAIAVGMQLHLPLSKLIELGQTCILHEIGMVRLPPQLYMTERKLTPIERAKLSKHTVLGYTIVKDLNFPLGIQLGVLEHHENENGTGYPRKLPSEKISSNAKIISVVCSYEAISSPRSYRDERSTFETLLELIQNKEHNYDDAVVKALLYTVSLYPIGTYVYLSNRKIAEVVDSNSENPKCPVVQMLTEKEKDGSLKIVQTGGELSILRILTKEEKKDILALIEQKSENIKTAQEEAEKKNPKQEKTETPKQSVVSGGLEEITDDDITSPAQEQAHEPQNEQIPQTSAVADDATAKDSPSHNGDADKPVAEAQENEPSASSGIEEVDISFFS